MLYTQIVCLALTAAFTASQVSAIAHGEVADHDGKEIRWQQLGKGMYTGVPADEWNDEIHKRSEIEHDIDEILALEKLSWIATDRGRDLVLESRNLKGFCQATVQCAKDKASEITGITIQSTKEAWFTAANYAKPKGKSLWEFLNQPFVSAVVGGIIQGVIVNEADTSDPKPEPAECSTAANEVDAFIAAVSEALKYRPTAFSASFALLGPTTTVMVTMQAVPEGETPTTTPGEC